MTDLYKPRPDRLFRFSLRTMFVVLTVLGMALGWVGVQMKWIRDRQQARQWMATNPFVKLRPSKSGIFNTGYFIPYNEAPWSIRVFGEHGLSYIPLETINPPTNKAYSAEDLQRLFPEARIGYLEDMPPIP